MNENIRKGKELENFLLCQISSVPDVLKAERLIKHTRDVCQVFMDAQGIYLGMKASMINGNRIRSDLSLIPDISEIDSLHSALEESIKKYSRVKTLYDQILKIEELKGKMQAEMDEIPVVDINPEIKECLKKYDITLTLFSAIEECQERKSGLRSSLGNVPEIKKEDFFDDIRKAVSRFEHLVALQKEKSKIVETRDRLVSDLKAVCSEIDKTSQEREDLMKTIRVCPVTKKPITEFCGINEETL